MRSALPRIALVALVALAVLLATRPAAAPAQSFVPAHPARDFGDSIGVNVRLTWLDTAYGDFDTLHARLRELGVRYVSDSVCPSCDYQIDRLQRLAQSGIRANLGIGWMSGGTASIAPGLAAVRTQLRDSVVSLGGLNEPDISGVADWVNVTRAFHTELYRQVKADPFLSRFPVLGPSLVNRESRAALGDLAGHVDRGNLHPYPGGLPPLGHLADERQMMAQVSGSKPLVISEVGYHTYMSHVGPHRPASEQAVAVYTPRIALEAFSFGIERTYLFQFVDPWSAAEAQARGIPPSENSFGLLRTDLSRKPAFLALRNLLRAVDGGSAPVANPGGMRLAIEGAGPDVRHLLLRSADGSYALVLWRTASVWDRAAQVDLVPAPDHVEVALGQPVALARRFDPLLTDAATASWTDPSRIGVDLGGAPVVLRLTPPGAEPGRALRGAGLGRPCVERRPGRAQQGSHKAKRRKAAARRRAAARRSATWTRWRCVKPRR